MADDQAVVDQQEEVNAPVLTEAEQVAKKLEEMRALLADPRMKAVALRINEQYQKAKNATINRGGRYRRANPDNKLLGLDSAADYALLKLLVKEQETKEELSAAAKKQVKPNSLMEHQIIDNQRFIEKLLEKAGHPGQFPDDIDGHGIVRLFNTQLANQNKSELTPAQANTLIDLYNPESLGSNFGMIARAIQNGADDLEIETDTKNRIDAANSIVALLELNPKEFDFSSNVNATISFLKDKFDGQKLVDAAQPGHQEGVDAKVEAMQKAINAAALKAVNGKKAPPKEELGEEELKEEKPVEEKAKIAPKDFPALAAAKLALMNEFVVSNETRRTAAQMDEEYQDSIDARYKLIGGAGRGKRWENSRALRSGKFRGMLSTREDYALLDLLEQREVINNWSTEAENDIESWDDHFNNERTPSNRKALLVLAGMNPKKDRAPGSVNDFLKLVEANLGADNMNDEMRSTLISLYHIEDSQSYFNIDAQESTPRTWESLESDEEKQAYLDARQNKQDEMIANLDAMLDLALTNAPKATLDSSSIVEGTFEDHVGRLNAIKVHKRDNAEQRNELKTEQVNELNIINSKIQSAALIAVGDYNEIAEAKIAAVREEVSSDKYDYKGMSKFYQFTKKNALINFAGIGKLFRGINAAGSFFVNNPQDKELIFASRKDFELLKLQFEKSAIESEEAPSDKEAISARDSFNNQIGANRKALAALGGLDLKGELPVDAAAFIAVVETKIGSALPSNEIEALTSLYDTTRISKNDSYNVLKMNLESSLNKENLFSGPETFDPWAENNDRMKSNLSTDLKSVIEKAGLLADDKAIDAMVSNTIKAHSKHVNKYHIAKYDTQGRADHRQQVIDRSIAKQEEMKQVALRQAGEPNAIAKYRKETPLITKIRNHWLTGPVVNTAAVVAVWFTASSFMNKAAPAQHKKVVKTEQVSTNNKTISVTSPKTVAPFDASKFQHAMDSIKQAGQNTPVLQQQQPIQKPQTTLPKSPVVTAPVDTTTHTQHTVTTPVASTNVTPVIAKAKTGTKTAKIVGDSTAHPQQTVVAKPAKQPTTAPVVTAPVQQTVVAKSIIAQQPVAQPQTVNPAVNPKGAIVKDTTIVSGNNQQPTAADSLAIKQALMQQKADSLNANLAKLALIKTQMTNDSLANVETQKSEMRKDWVGFTQKNITVTGNQASQDAEITISKSKLNATLDVLSGDSTFSVKAMKDQFKKQLDTKKDQQKADGTFDRSTFRKEKRQGKAIIEAVEKGLDERKLNAAPAAKQSEPNKGDDVYGNGGNKQTAIHARKASDLGSTRQAVVAKLAQHAATGSDVATMFSVNAKDKSAQLDTPELPSGIMGYQMNANEFAPVVKPEVAGLSKQYTSSATSSGNNSVTYRYVPMS